MVRQSPGLFMVAACLAALALRLLLPVGWMPVAGSDAIVISLCSGSAVADPATPTPDGDQPCGFALSLGPALLAAVALLPLLAMPFLPVAQIVPHKLHVPHWPPRPPGQGPPAF
jgi:hypothetical protein